MISGFVTVLLFHVPSMLLVMTVDAKQFPITAVGRIIVVVVILVMNSEFLKLIS